MMNVSLSMLRFLLSLITLLSVLVAQESGKWRGPTTPPPRVMTPSRIRVGCAVQSAYVGPAGQWFNSGPNSLSDAPIANLEKALATNPEDICVRGYLIAHGQGYVSRRMDHVLWMVQNHPEWDGFM